MRLVEVLIPKGKRDSVLKTLDAEGIDYAAWQETGRGDFEAVVQFPIPPVGVEPVLEKLRKAGVGEDTYTIVLAPEMVISRRIDTLKEHYPDQRISREELITRAQDLAPPVSTYAAFLILSTAIATAGLLLDSVATIIGAMVIAPLMGPAISTSVGTVVYDRKLVTRGLTLQIAGLLLAIAVGALIGFLVMELGIMPPGIDIREISQVAERTSPNFLSLFLALGSGIAGAISIIRNAGSALVGVAIAAALVPPAATAGLGFAFGLPAVAIISSVLVLVNVLAINISALVLFWLSGFRPLRPSAVGRARKAVVSNVMVLGVAIAILSTVLGLVTYVSSQTALMEQQAKAEVSVMLNESEYEDMRLVTESVDVSYRPADLILNEPARVTVILYRRAGQELPPGIAQRIDDHLTEFTGREVRVRVGFIEAQQTT
ncbi:TIGR00341 family protein [Methanosarcina hadiensis]|uniref:TIGR00341 family protein n=1 Tax=Methanosarcina hadiensis TaxID=3078083 RepID=UPI003977633E